MTLAEHYTLLKGLHVLLAFTSVTLFLGRGLGVMVGSNAPLATPIRRSSQVIDTALLVSAVLLATAIRIDPFATAWLQAKLGLLVAYIVTGYVALRSRNPITRIMSFGLALACFTSMMIVARSKDPLAPVGWLLRPA